MLIPKKSIAVGFITLVVTSSSFAEYPVAGVDPSQRPVGAPEQSEAPKSGEWYQRSLSGVNEPFPSSLQFLEDQGGWFNPFINPGMTGRYDIRGWHANTD